MRARLPALHWPSIRGRARADAGPLLLVAGVVLVITMLAAAVPPLMRSTADAAARDAIRRAGPDASVRVQAPWEYDYGIQGGRVRNEHLADDVADLRQRAEDGLDPSLKAALRPPVTTVTSTTFAVTDGSVQRHFQLDYLQNTSGGPAVTWVAGHAPRGTVAGNPEIPLNGPKWQAQVGLSEADAAALELGPGDHVPIEDDLRTKYNILVSGIFRPVDPADPAWELAPWALRPVADLDGSGSTRLGGLLTAESLPDARLALLDDQMTRAVWYAADPDKLTWESAQQLATTVAKLKANSAASAERDDSLKWNTQLDGVLRAVRAQVNAAYARASVLLIAVLAGGVLLLLLAAELLVRRRAATLTVARQRGAGLPTLVAELVVESVAVTVPAAALGVLAAYLVADGAALWWATPVIVCALAAGPALSAVAAAGATRDRRVPANRGARRWALRTAQMRRAVVDLAVLAAAAGAVVALRQRGIAPGQDTALPASAPTLGVITAALVLLRLMPAGTGLILRQSLRSRRPLAVFGAARAAVTATRVLPLLVLTATTGLAAYAVTLDATTSRGAADAAWQAVGAEARLDLVPDVNVSAQEIAARIAAAPGVSHAVAAQVTHGLQVIADKNAVSIDLVVVDAASFQQLLESTPLPRAPALSRLRPGAGPVPALVRTGDGSLRPGMTIGIDREKSGPLELTAVGAAPAIGAADDVIIVDASAGMPFIPNTIWVTGPGAARAAKDNASGGQAVVRAEVLRDRTSAPLNAGLVALDWIAAGTLLALGLLGFALAAAASAPERWETLARLRTLGLRPRDARWVAGAELLPPVLVAAVCGPLLALPLAGLTFAPLGLRTLTGQTSEPSIVVPWWLLGATSIALFVALVVQVAAEAAVRRRRRLGDVLRVGGG
jgi:putative ABC transport system permease protein